MGGGRGQVTSLGRCVMSAHARVPLGLAHPRLPLVISNQLKEFVAAGLGDSYPSLMLPRYN